MRESRTFAERSRLLKSDEVLKKYYLICEGSSTEFIYFNAVDSLREEIGINPLIELIPIVRSYSEEGWSNPKKILDRLIENFDENRLNCMSYETLLNRIMDYFDEEKVIPSGKGYAKELWNAMVGFCNEKLHKKLADDVEDIEEVCITILQFLKQNYNIVDVISNVSEIIKESGLTYAEGFDEICLIIDRDKESFCLYQKTISINML